MNSNIRSIFIHDVNPIRGLAVATSLKNLGLLSTDMNPVGANCRIVPSRYRDRLVHIFIQQRQKSFI